MTDDAVLEALQARCERSLAWHGRRSAADLLDSIDRASAVDRYGEGGVVAELESECAAVLGKPAALFFPSGTMAQQITLRVHADRRNNRAIVFHPACHLDRHEGGAYHRLQSLIGRPAGDQHRLLDLDDLRAVAEPIGALVLELPQRDIGGQQPDLPSLRAQVAWARDRGAAVHLDGARLWESAAGYGVPAAQVAALFDTVYVSFYKGLGALAGCCVAGDEQVIAELREWRQRMGGTVFALWPYAASALTALRERMPRMADYLRHARAIAAALKDAEGVVVVPDPPHTSMMHLLLRTTPEAFTAAARELAEQQGIWSWARTGATTDPAVQQVELSVGEATCRFTPAQIRDVLIRLAGS